MYSFYEFFAGGGMARAGLGPEWECLFANDIDNRKCHAYQNNWGGKALTTADVATVKPADIPKRADLAWASFPCQDLSLAGGGAGLDGERSGTFWPFWKLIKQLAKEGRPPKIVALENVCGALTSHGGKDFSAICAALQQENYRCGAMVIDAALFVPQSRPRLFVVGLHQTIAPSLELTCSAPSFLWHPQNLLTAHDGLRPQIKKNWIWWNLPTPPKRSACFADLIEDGPTDVRWHSKDTTRQLLTMMSDRNREKVEKAKRTGTRMVGAVYKRTRIDDFGEKIQRAEIRFDDIAGCLRTPAGGSSRQIIMIVQGSSVRSRLISTRETARLMGLPDEYKLPNNYNEAYHLTGDGVVVPVVRYLAAHLFEPLLSSIPAAKRAAA